MSRQACITVLGGLLLCAAAHPLCAQPSFTGIGDLPGGLFGSLGLGVSMDGMVVVGISTAGGFGEYEPIRWDAESGITPLDTDWRGDAMNADGTGSVIVGSIILTGTREAFRWTEAERIVGLGDLPGGEFRSGAGGVSAHGDIISGGGWSDNGQWEAFLWTKESGLVPLGDLPGGIFQSGALRTSADGKVVVGYGSSRLGQEAMRWTAEIGMVGLGDMPDGQFSNAARAVSADGSVVVGNGLKSDGERGFRWTEQTGMVALPKIHPAQTFQRAFGTSWDGNVIVGELGVSGVGFGAFYWTPEEGTRWLTDVLTEHGVEVPEGWHVSRASAVSADGRTIVGSGVNPEGGGEGWVAYLGPGCRADYDENGVVDAEDVAAYLTSWLDSSIFADWNYDGSINTRDLLGFLNEWVAQPGCE